MNTITEQLADALRLVSAGNTDYENLQEIARNALAAYDAQQAWSEQDASAASVEGWCVSDTSDGFAEIQRIDETEVFGEDAQAIAHVYWMAGTGSDVHKRAITYTLRDGNTWTYTQASIAARAERSAHIRLCVNAHDALVSALQGVMPYAENEVSAILDLADDGDEHADEECEAATSTLEAARAALEAAGVPNA